MSIKTTFIVSVLLASTPALASPEIQATSIQGGTWITVTQDGLPVPDVVVNNGFVTDDTGRVYINNLLEQSRSLTFSAITPDGEILETQIFSPRGSSTR